jgi:hypothetical protein
MCVPDTGCYTLRSHSLFFCFGCQPSPGRGWRIVPAPFSSFFMLFTAPYKEYKESIPSFLGHCRVWATKIARNEGKAHPARCGERKRARSLSQKAQARRRTFTGIVKFISQHRSRNGLKPFVFSKMEWQRSCLSVPRPRAAYAETTL